MAFLQKIRNKPKFLISIIAIALLAFIFPWNEVTSYINRQKSRAFSVSGENVSMETFSERVSNFVDLQKAVNPQASFDDDAMTQVRFYVYQQMLNETILNIEGEKIGLAVPTDEMQDLIYGNNLSPLLSQLPFFINQQTGQVDKNAIIQFAKNANTNTSKLAPEQRAQIDYMKSIWNNIQNMIKYSRLEQKYNALLANTVLVNNIEIEASKVATASTSNIAYVVNRYSLIPDSTVNVSQKEVEKLYNERKNSFRSDENIREISYVTKQVVPSEEDYKVAYDEINKAINQLNESSNPALVLADYPEAPFNSVFYSLKDLPAASKTFVESASVGASYGPIKGTDSYDAYKLLDKKLASDSVEFSFINLPINMNADSIINVIKEGKSFATVANELNPNSNGGKAGWVTEASLSQIPNLDKSFIPTVFNNPVGSINKLSIQGGNQLIQIDAKTQPITKYMLATIKIPIVISDETFNLADNELNQFVASVDPKSFVKKAQEMGYNVTPDASIASSQIAINQIPGSRQVIFWAFNEKIGSIKKFELSDYRVVAMVDSKTDKGYIPLSAVEESLRNELINDKKAEKMIADMKSKNLNSLEGYAQSIPFAKVDTASAVTFQTPNILGLGFEPVLNVYSELGEVNKLSAPIKGNTGVFVVNVLDKKNDSDTFNAQQYIQMTNNQNYYLIMSQAMNALKEKMDVKENLISFF